MSTLQADLVTFKRFYPNLLLKTPVKGQNPNAALKYKCAFLQQRPSCLDLWSSFSALHAASRNTFVTRHRFCSDRLLSNTTLPRPHPPRSCRGGGDSVKVTKMLSHSITGPSGSVGMRRLPPSASAPRHATCVRDAFYIHLQKTHFIFSIMWNMIIYIAVY